MVIPTNIEMSVDLLIPNEKGDVYGVHDVDKDALSNVVIDFNSYVVDNLTDYIND